MLIRVSKKIELIANVAIIVVACLLAGVLVKNYYLGKSIEETNNAQSDHNLNGKQLSSLNIDWRQNQQTLILAISTTCHFCSESGSFYQRLTRKATNTHLLAVLPQTVEEGKQYLSGLGVPIRDIRQEKLDSFGVQGTPTLILVDDKGTIISSWVGKVNEQTEQEILSRLE